MSLPERLLYGIIAAQFVAIVIVTIWALTAKPVPTVRIETPPDKAEAPITQQRASLPEDSIFTGIGRLRARLAVPSQKGADGGAAVVITIAFPYDGLDRAFMEELAFNTRKFRSITTDYLGSIPPDSPLLTDEAALKHELLSRYNDLLYLGKIETLYFTEFIIIE